MSKGVEVYLLILVPMFFLIVGSSDEMRIQYLCGDVEWAAGSSVSRGEVWAGSVLDSKEETRMTKQTRHDLHSILLFLLGFVMPFCLLTSLTPASQVPWQRPLPYCYL